MGSLVILWKLQGANIPFGVWNPLTLFQIAFWPFSHFKGSFYFFTSKLMLWYFSSEMSPFPIQTQNHQKHMIRKSQKSMRNVKTLNSPGNEMIALVKLKITVSGTILQIFIQKGLTSQLETTFI